MFRFKRGIIAIACLVLIALAGCSTIEPATHLADGHLEIQTPVTGHATPWTKQPLLNDPDNFQFAIMSDRTGGRRGDVFSKAVDKVNLLQPEFVICVGDLIKGYTQDIAKLNSENDVFDDIVNRLDMRFFRVVGNHDISNDAMTDLYRQRYGHPYYHFVYKDTLFLVINTEDPPQKGISDTQGVYMNQALADNPDVRWTLVFMHKPLFVEEAKHPHPGWQKIEDQLKNRRHSVFAGHWHQYAKYTKNDQCYIRLATTGGGSKLSGIEQGEFDHIVWVTMTDDGPRLANLMLDGIHDQNVRVEE